MERRKRRRGDPWPPSPLTVEERIERALVSLIEDVRRMEVPVPSDSYWQEVKSELIRRCDNRVADEIDHFCQTIATFAHRQTFVEKKD
jgi:hypothetical protein